MLFKGIRFITVLVTVFSHISANVINIGDLLVIDYKILENEKFTMTVSMKTQGYIGIGFGTSGMPGSQMIIGNFQNGNPVVVDRSSPNYDAPLLDANQQIEDVSGTRNSTWTTFTFTRSIKKNGNNLFALDQHVKFIYAYGLSDDFVFHQNQNGNTVLTFSKKNIVCDSSCMTCLGPEKSDCTSCYKDFTLINKQCFPAKVTLPVSYMKINEDFTVYFDFKNDQTIDFVFKYPQDTFFGLGIGGYGMDNVDILVCEFMNYQIQITDRYSFKTDYPAEDTDLGGTDDVVPIAGEVIKESNGKRYNLIHFNRKLNTGDSKDIVISQGKQKFSYAFYPKTASLDYHGPNRESFNGYLIQGKQSEVEVEISGLDSRIKAHGKGQLILWGMAADILTMLTRFFRSKPYYLELHLICFYILDISTLVLSLLILIPDSDFYWTLMSDKKFLLHFILGVTAMILVIFQHLFGTVMALAIKSSKGTPFIQKLRIAHQVENEIILVEWIFTSDNDESGYCSWILGSH